MKKDSKNSLKAYLAFVLLSEAVGALSGWLSRDGMTYYSAFVEKPPLSPPPVVFPIVWGVLFALMGIGAARVYLEPSSRSRSVGLRLFFVQLAFNFVWSLIFFQWRAYGAAFFWLVILWILVLSMTLTFREVRRWAGTIQIPYLAWVLFAGYLNLGVWLLNR